MAVEVAVEERVDKSDLLCLLQVDTAQLALSIFIHEYAGVFNS